MAGTTWHRCVVALGGVLAVALLLVLARPAQAAPAATPTAADLALEREIAAEITEERRALGRRALVGSKKLVRAARAHVRAMAREGYFSHSLAGSSLVRWVEDFYPSNPDKVGQTIFWASGQATADQVLRVWLASPSHRATVLARKWRAVGVAALFVKQAPGVFGGRDVTIVSAVWAPHR